MILLKYHHLTPSFYESRPWDLKIDDCATLGATGADAYTGVYGAEPTHHRLPGAPRDRAEPIAGHHRQLSPLPHAAGRGHRPNRRGEAGRRAHPPVAAVAQPPP